LRCPAHFTDLVLVDGNPLNATEAMRKVE